MVKILRDEPSELDRFGSGKPGDGPHDRVAAAIERRIFSEEGGGTIGLEGDYGSGKSTVVRLLQNRLQERQDVCFIVFDAWSHEGDPLRRAFLETLINELEQAPNWILAKKWSEEKERLAQRHRKSKERKTSSPSGFGIMMGLATALVPIGLILSRLSVDSATLDLEWNREIAWWMVVGLALTAAPLEVAALRLIGLICSFLLRKATSPISRSSWDWLRKLKYRCRKGSPKYLRECFNPQRFNFLSQHGILETQSDAFETADPTSIEFEALFNDLVSDAISDTTRRIVLVVDNLDRLTADQSLSVWSNLQTFVGHSALKGNSWSSRFSLIVPFTPSAIRDRLIRTGAIPDANSLFQKTFQIRYATPPPTLSDWHGYLRFLLDEAIPELGPNDQNAVVETVDLIRREATERVVPRGLKLFVNQLAVLWDIWGSGSQTLPAAHLAYAVRHTADRDDFE